MAHRIREAMREGAWDAFTGIVEIDETIYGRAATHPVGRRTKQTRKSPADHQRGAQERGALARATWRQGSRLVLQGRGIVVLELAKDAQLGPPQTPARRGGLSEHDNQGQLGAEKFLTGGIRHLPITNRRCGLAGLHDSPNSSTSPNR